MSHYFVIFFMLHTTKHDVNVACVMIFVLFLFLFCCNGQSTQVQGEYVKNKQNIINVDFSDTIQWDYYIMLSK